MWVIGDNIPADTSVVFLDTPNQITLSKPATGSGTSPMTFKGDQFKILLIKDTPTYNFDHTQTNVGVPGSGTPSASNVGTDEVVGPGYHTGGNPLTNVGPSLPGNPDTTATVSFAPDPTWVLATFRTTAAIIYNSSTRQGAALFPMSGRTVAVFDFGGPQEVSNGTLTLVMPSNDGYNAVLRLA